MKRIALPALALLMLSAGCKSESTTPPATGLACAPACDPARCQVCTDVGGAAQCASLCGAGLTCEAGRCVAPSVASCDPGCGPCQVCDTSGAVPSCVALCDAGLECRDGVCAAPVVASCAPACGPCESCDLSGPTPSCVSRCAAGLACNAGVCEAPPAPACEPACAASEYCEIGAPPTCKPRCGDGLVFANDTCVRAGFHARLDALDVPFADGPAVTAVCVDCHADEAAHVLASPHFRWQGPTPNLAGHEGASDIGKRNLINNFCVSIPGNEKRCSQCHAGYEYDGPGFDFDVITKVDCLACHADPASGYRKAPKDGGRVDPSVDLALAARSVGVSTRQSCGSCHFGAGGGDNVKKGDLGSALARPTPSTDVHMGRGFSCATCHAGDAHAILGQGVHNPVSAGRLDCTGCHGAAPHGQAVLDDHALDVACQTCHIPAFSRQQPTKTWWDWSTAGDRRRGTDGVVRGALADGTPVVEYDFMKGDFRWQKSVRPTYAWYDGRVEHMTLASSYPTGSGSEAEPVVIARPLAGKLDAAAKIFPFKVMTGRQPAHIARRFLIAPKLFGPGGFWPQIPAAADWDAAAVRALWTSSLTLGARAAGQLGAQESLADGDWGWVHTEMYLGINHEVAPKADALGQAPCAGCHGPASGFPWQALGYACDPIGDPIGCGSRHR